MLSFLSGLFDSNEKELKRLQPDVDEINELEPEFQKLTDEELRAKTAEFRARIAEATASMQPRLEEAKKELEEAKALPRPGDLGCRQGRRRQAVPARPG